MSVISEKDSDLNILSSFGEKELVNMRWRQPGKKTEIYDAVIVKTNGKLSIVRIYWESVSTHC